MTKRRDYIEVVPQATKREREWARSVAHMIVFMVRQHQGEIKGDAEELAGRLRMNCALQSPY